MISSKKLIKMVRKWQRMATLSRIRLLPLPRTTNHDSNAASLVAHKGHFVIYTADKRRFTVPLQFLYNDVIQELFKMSEDEFGFSSGGPITVPCDAASMEYMISLIQRGCLAKDLEKALLNSVASNRFSLLAPVDRCCVSTQVVVCVH